MVSNSKFFFFVKTAFVQGPCICMGLGLQQCVNKFHFLDRKEINFAYFTRIFTGVCRKPLYPIENRRKIITTFSEIKRFSVFSPIFFKYLSAKSESRDSEHLVTKPRSTVSSFLQILIRIQSFSFKGISGSSFTKLQCDFFNGVKNTL